MEKVLPEKSVRASPSLYLSDHANWYCKEQFERLQLWMKLFEKTFRSIQTPAAKGFVILSFCKQRLMLMFKALLLILKRSETVCVYVFSEAQHFSTTHFHTQIHCKSTVQPYSLCLGSHRPHMVVWELTQHHFKAQSLTVLTIMLSLQWLLDSVTVLKTNRKLKVKAGKRNSSIYSLW